VKQWSAFNGTEKRIIQTTKIKFLRRGTGQSLRDELRNHCMELSYKYSDFGANKKRGSVTGPNTLQATRELWLTRLWDVQWTDGREERGWTA